MEELTKKWVAMLHNDETEKVIADIYDTVKERGAGKISDWRVIERSMEIYGEVVRRSLR